MIFKRDCRSGFSLVEAAIALVAAALFCGAVIMAVTTLYRADEQRLRNAEAALEFDTILTRHILGAESGRSTEMTPGWNLETMDSLDGKTRIRRYRFTPENRPSLRFEMELRILPPAPAS